MTDRLRVESLVAHMENAAALPRENGELVFAAPWESRAFGMAVALHEQGVYGWDEFRDHLIAEIRTHESDDGGRYYRRWLASFEHVLLERGIVTEEEITRRAHVLAKDGDHAHEHT